MRILKVILLLFMLLRGDLIHAQWDTLNTYKSNFYLRGLDFLCVDTGFVTGAKIDTVNATAVGVILRTKDAGNSWDTTFLAPNITITSIHFPSNDTGYACGSGGYIYKTVNGGTTWLSTNSPTSQNLDNIFFVNNEIGFCGNADGQNIFLETEDGFNWIVKPGVSSRDIDFRTVGNGFTIAGNGGYTTSDTGQVWTIFSANGGNRTYFDIDFIDTTNGFIGGNDQDFGTGSVAKTIDGGNNWSNITVPYVGQIHAIKFLTPLLGFAVGEANGFAYSILKTTDGGNTWFAQSINNHNDYPTLMAIDCLDTLNCYCIAPLGGEIYKTVNGGGVLIPLNISEIQDESHIRIYPNPATTHITLSFSSFPNGKGIVNMCGVTGKLIASFNVSEDSRNVILNIENFPSGVYMINYVDSRNIMTAKFIKL